MYFVPWFSNVVPAGQHARVAGVLTATGETVVRLGEIVPVKGDAPRVVFSGHLDLAW